MGGIKSTSRSWQRKAGLVARFAGCLSGGCLLSILTMAQTSQVIQTPRERFHQLTNYPFKAHFVTIEPGLNMHYVEEGAPTQPLILLLHGEPAWSYIYRDIIPALVANGYRVIAPDLIGFGKSDKLTNRSDYTYAKHTAWLQAFINTLKLVDIHLYAHDWGGMIGLRVVGANPQLFAAVAVSDAFLFTGEEELPESFLGWQTFSQTDPAFQAGQIIEWGSYHKLADQTKQAYNAPFPDESYKAGVRQFPLLIPKGPATPEARTNAQLRAKLKQFSKPFLTLWGDNQDALWTGKDVILQQEIAGAKNQPHRVLHAGHFLQEDVPQELTNCLVAFFNQTQRK